MTVSSSTTSPDPAFTHSVGRQYSIHVNDQWRVCCRREAIAYSNEFNVALRHSRRVKGADEERSTEDVIWQNDSSIVADSGALHRSSRVEKYGHNGKK